MDPSAEELRPEDKENPSRKGRPKGSKNKRKRGRPKSKKKYVYRPKKKEIDNSDVQIPELPQIKNYKAKEVFVIPNTLDATPVIEAEAPKFSQDTVIESLLDDEKLKEESLHVPKEINQEPLDPSYYYRGSKNIPVAGAEYAFTADMVEELRKCQEDIVYFAENFFHIVTLDKRGKSKIKLYEAQKKMLLNMVNHRFTANLSCRQSGKALALDTPIRTTKGWKTMGELTTKDKVYGSNGTPINITHVHGVLENRECYKVTFDNGEEIIADAEHQWFTQHRKERQKKITGSVKTTKQILDTLYAPYSKEPGHRIPVCTNGLLLGSADLPIEPYVLGYWLGDGASEGGSIIVGNRDLNFVINKLKQSKQFDSITTRTYEYCNSTYVTISVSSDKHKNSLSSILRKIGLIHNKHIPEIYFSANREQKLELLRGLMDSDGYIDKNGNAYFYNTNKILAEQVLALTQELGYKPTFLNRVAKLKGIAKKIVYTVSFTPREQVVTIPFKAERLKLQRSSTSRALYHYIKSIEKCASVPVRCITVKSPDSLYLAGKSLIPTHNSTLLTIFVLWSTCFNDDYRAAIVANKEATAVNIFKRIRLAYEQLPNYIKPGVKDYAKTGMTLGNDSSIIVSTTTATSIRGDTLNCICLDEAAFIESHILEEFWASVIPSISSGKTSKILMVSTPNGVGNKFYEIFSGAENGSVPEWKASRIDWWDVPGRDEAWKKSMIAVLGSEEKFSQEFGNTFLDNDACAIGSILIEKFKREKKEPIWTSPDGEYTVFEYPNNEKLYVIGVDVGEGIGRAASVAQVLDVTDLQEIKQVAVYASTVIEPYHFANKLNVIGNSWGAAPMLIERNNCGAQVIDALHYKHGYEKIVSYSKISESEKYNRTRNMGVLSHTNIRFDGVQNMRYWVNHLQTVRINDARTISEFETFVRQPNGVYRKRNDNFFDDRIMSLVWALFILEPEICQQYFEIADYDNQHKPLKIFSNGYWEISNENYDLKDLSKEQNIVRPSYLDPKSPKMPTLTEFFEMDKYDVDVESLQSLGYQFFDPNV